MIKVLLGVLFVISCNIDVNGYDQSGTYRSITIPMSTKVEHKTLDVKVSDTITESRSCTYMGVCCDCGLNVFGKDMVGCGCGVRSHCSGHETVSFKRKESTN